MNSDHEESDVSTVTLGWSYEGIETDTEELSATTVNSILGQPGPIRTNDNDDPLGGVLQGWTAQRRLWDDDEDTEELSATTVNSILGQPGPIRTNYNDDPLGGVLQGLTSRRRLWDDDEDADADDEGSDKFADFMRDIEEGAARKPTAPCHQYQAEEWEGAAMFNGEDSQDTSRLGPDDNLEASERRRPLQVETEKSFSTTSLQEKRALKRLKEQVAYNLFFQINAQDPLAPGEQGGGVKAQRLTSSVNPYAPARHDLDLDDDISSIGNSLTSYLPGITHKSERMMMTTMTTRIPNPPPSKSKTPKSKISQPNARRDDPPDILNTATGITDLTRTETQDSGDNNYNKGTDVRSSKRFRPWVAAACLSLVVLIVSIAGLAFTVIWLRFADNDKDSTNSTLVDPPQFFYPNATSGPSSSPTLGAPTTNATNNSTDTPPLVSGLVDLLERIELVSPNSLSFLDDSDTPQFQAYEWLAFDPEYLEYSPDRIIQRWALAVFFFSTAVQDSSNNNRRALTESSVSSNSSLMSSYTNECSWYSTDPLDELCNQDGMLTAIHVAAGGLEGTIPSELALLSNWLESMHLSSNRLIGTIPPELGQLTRLGRLQLTMNDLTGTIPSAIGLLTDLIVLELGQNQIRGALPFALGNLESLRTLGLEGNQITGTIPPEFAGMINIESFAFESNLLNGTIPVEVGELSRLSSLSVHQNDLTGEMPLSLCPVPDSSMSSLKADCDKIICDCCTYCCIGPTCLSTTSPSTVPSTTSPSTIPSEAPSVSSAEPSLSVVPTKMPSYAPSLSSNPTFSIMPSDIPSTVPSVAPSSSPSKCLSSISTDKLCFGKEETIQVTFENCYPAASDWMTIRQTKYASPPFFRDEALWLRSCGSQTCTDPVKSGNVTFDERLGGYPEYHWPLYKGKYKIYLIQDSTYTESAEIEVDHKHCQEP